MTRRAKKLSWSLLARAVLIGATVIVLIYVARHEARVHEFAGCYDCGWNLRQALLLVVGAVLLLFRFFWTAVVSLLASLKVIYSVGYMTFFNNFMEVHGTWQIVRTSTYWAWKLWPEHFLEFLLALVVFAIGVRSIALALHRRARAT